jgi:hypothetical protein
VSTALGPQALAFSAALEAPEGTTPPGVSGLVTSYKQVRREGDYFAPAGEGRLRRMRTGVRFSARLIQEITLTSERGRRAAMVTLTYAPGVEWGRRHVSVFLDCVMKWAARRGASIPYVWVAELQMRGAVHFHVVLWLPKGLVIPKPDKRGWWPHGSTRVEWARRVVGYLTKYASKGEGGVGFPRGLRLWASGGLCGTAREWRSWLRLPAWLRASVVERQRVVRIPGGLWVAELTGECYRSPYEFVGLERVDGRVAGAWFRLRDAADTGGGAAISAGGAAAPGR